MHNRNLSEHQLLLLKSGIRRALTSLIVRSINLSIINPTGEKIAFFDIIRPLLNSQERDLGFMIQDVSDAVIDGNLEFERPFPVASDKLVSAIAVIIANDTRLVPHKKNTTFKKLLEFINPGARWDSSKIDFNKSRE